MSSLDWNKLRVWKTSQQDAFEELCCQLAHAEKCPGGSFVRNAPPDAGVECYWQFDTGEEWGWQAKFPRTGLTNKLWSELDDSLETAFEKRPKLTRYYICLPFSFSEGRVQRKGGTHVQRLKSGRDRWNEHVTKWKSWAKKLQRRVEFVLWDEHELWLRLSKDEHRGRRFFWFNEVIFDAAWFGAQLTASVQQAGDRYDAAFNVTVPEGQLFPALARTPEFWKRLEAWAVNLQQALTRELRYEDAKETRDECSAVRAALAQNIAAMNSLPRNEAASLDFALVHTSLEATSQACSGWNEKLRKLCSAAYAEYEKAHGHRPEPYENIGPGGWHTLREVERRVSETARFLKKPEAALVNNPFLLLMGQAGSGKTHLLCGSAETLYRYSVPVILLMGEQFHDVEPWNQILSLLGLKCTRDEFLGALDAAAEAAQTRAVIFIDALNEGEGLKVWPRHLAAFLVHIQRWPRLALALSVRTGYETVIFRPEVIKHFTNVTHHGFANVELEAAARFFEHFGIATPSVPVLSPDFANPLFLKLFCRALQNAGLKEVPTGVHGITSVFDFFLETINKKLSKPTELDFDPSSRVVQRAVDRLSELMVNAASPRLPLEQVRSELSQILPRSGYENSLERRLRVESVIARQPEYSTTPASEAVRFTYERFTHHRMIRVLLGSVKRGQERELFAKNSPLWELVKQAGWYWQTQGLWDALAIQLPELFGRELPDILPRSKDCAELSAAFLASIIWRNRNAFTDRTAHWIEYYRDASTDGYAKTLDTLLAVSTCADHPFNADYLHQFLVSEKMPARDAKWSIFLFKEYGEGRSVDRLIEWALSERGHAHFDNETARLAGVALAWFFTTSHRFVRDRATKALVSLMERRLPVLGSVLRQFKGVDDLYLTERLYAAAFGAALRSEELPHLKALAQQVFDDVFRDGSPPPHIALRDYAKGVVQTAINHGLAIEGDTSRLIPPYRTSWIRRLPTLAQLRRHFGEYGGNEKDRGGARLYHSVTGDDFCHYEMGDLRMWSRRRRGGMSKPSALQIYQDFEDRLTQPLKSEFDRYEIERRRHDKAMSREGFNADEEFREREKWLRRFEEEFTAQLGSEHGRKFRNVIVPMLQKQGRPTGDETFDKELLQRWILHRAIRFGWTKGRFGLFDGRAAQFDRRGREAYKPERIGKKYQWLALEEFYARLSDNFEFAKDSWRTDDHDEINGRWMSDFRDLDPSLLLRSSLREGSEANPGSWWIQSSYADWHSKPTKLTWLNNAADLPEPKHLLEVLNARDGSEWLMLEGFAKWEHKEQIGTLGTAEHESREMWYAFRPYITTTRDFTRIWKWADGRRWFDSGMPESHPRLRHCLHEHFWPPRFDWPLEQDWRTHLSRGSENQLPGPILLAHDEYMCEQGTRDCSIDKTVLITLPCRWLVEKMKLRVRGRCGEFIDSSGQLIAFDPSTRESGPGALLMRKEPLLRFLKQSGHRLFWTFLGQKNIHPPRFSTGFEKWLGRLELNGAYTIEGGYIRGAFTASFNAGGLKEDSRLE